MFWANLERKNKMKTIATSAEMEKLLKKNDYVDENFYEGIAVAHTAGKWYHVNLKGNPLYPERYEYARNFYQGIAVVKLNGKEIFIGTDGRVLK